MSKEAFLSIEGSRSGPTSVILAGIHGNEYASVKVFGQMLPNLQIDSGKVWFGYGSPKAVSKRAKTIGPNPNRLFVPESWLSKEDKQSYEYGRVQIIKKYLDQADALLDIHGTRNPVTTPFIICEPNGYDLAGHLPFDLVVSGFDEHEPGGTDYYMNCVGKIGICVETGYNQDPLSLIRARQSIEAFLIARGHVNGVVEHRGQQRISIYRTYLTQTNDFRFARKFSDFEGLPKNCLIGIDGGELITADRSSLILFANPEGVIGAGSEAFLLAQ